MANYYVPAIEAVTNQDRLELSRAKAVSTILHGVIEELPSTDLPVLVARPTDNQKFQTWHDYAHDYASECRETMIAALEQNSRWNHPAQDRPAQEIGNLTLALMATEMDARKEAYDTVLPEGTTKRIAISDESEFRIRASVTEGWSTMDKQFRFHPQVVSQIGANIFFSYTLRQLQAEKGLLVSALEDLGCS